jgi:hypothetical protein
VKIRDLEKELAEVKDSLQKESDEHNTLRIAVRAVYDDLELAPMQVTSLLTVRATRIIDRACEIARDALCLSVHQLFTIARSHYENIDLAMMSQGFVPGYFDVELEQIEHEVVPLA